MRSQGAAVLLLLVLVLLAPTGLAWAQYRGDGARTSLVLPPSGPLDVVANLSLGEDRRVATFASAAFLPTLHGVVGVVAHGPSCLLATFDDLQTRPRESGPLPNCRGDGGVSLQAYDRATDSLLLCVEGPSDTGVLRALDPRTGATRWELRPAADLGLTPTEARLPWSCQGAALDPDRREVVLAFVSWAEAERYHRVASVDAGSGDVRWSTTVPTSAADELPLPSGRPPSVHLPRSVTLTTTGVLVVTHQNSCVQCSFHRLNEGGVAWFTREGGFRGSLRAVTGNAGALGADPALPVVSTYAVGAGPLAAVALGRELVLVNPEVAQPVARAPLRAIEPGSTQIFWPTGAWLDDRILVALPHSVTAFDSAGLNVLWSWSEGLDWNLRQVAVTAGGEVFALVGENGGARSMLVRLDARTGDVRGKLPLGLVPVRGPDDAWPVALTPVQGEAFLVVDGEGNVVTLGTAAFARRPRVGVSSDVPGVGETVRVQLQPGLEGNVTGYVVSWGDGALDELAPGDEAVHVYASPGPRALAVTAVYDGGLTGTTEVVLDVGGDPPEERGVLAAAFAPENENLTFGVLGIALTLLGGALTVGRARRRRATLERELRALDEVRRLADRDLAAAARALVAYREGLPVALGRGRVDDGQYAVLESRALRLLKLLRTRAFAPVESRLSPKLARMLDGAFEDGVLHGAECRNLVALLREEPRLDLAEQETLADFLRACVHESDLVGLPASELHDPHLKGPDGGRSD